MLLTWTQLQSWIRPLSKQWLKGVLSFVLAQLGAATTAYSTSVLPLEDEQRGRAVYLWTPLLTLVITLGSILLLDAFTTASVRKRRSFTFAIIFVYLISMVFLLYAFNRVEDAWKDPSNQPDFLYWHVQPIVFGLFFACLAGILISGASAIIDLIKSDRVLGIEVTDSRMQPSSATGADTVRGGTANDDVDATDL